MKADYARCWRSQYVSHHWRTICSLGPALGWTSSSHFPLHRISQFRIHHQWLSSRPDIGRHVYRCPGFLHDKVGSVMFFRGKVFLIILLYRLRRYKNIVFGLEWRSQMRWRFEKVKFLAWYKKGRFCDSVHIFSYSYIFVSSLFTGFG